MLRPFMRRLSYIFIAFLCLGNSGLASVETTEPTRRSLHMGAEGIASLSYIFLSRTQVINLGQLTGIGASDIDQLLGVRSDTVPNLLDMPRIGTIGNDSFKFSVMPPLTDRAPFGVSASWNF